MPPVPTPDSYPGIAGGRPIYAGKTQPPPTPTALRLYDWTDPGAPLLVGSLSFDAPAAPLVFQDETINSEIGEVAVSQSTQSIVYGEGGDAFEFGATRFHISPSLNDEVAGVPVYQILVACKPHGRWAEWPAKNTYASASDSTIPKAFKITVESEFGAVMHTFELQDGRAINYTGNPQARTATEALRPLFNCGMMLPWQSARIKLSASRTKWHPGVTAESVGPGDNRAGSAFNAAVPLMGGRFNTNSALHWFALPRWPVPWDDVYGSTVENNAMDPGSDPNMNLSTYYSGSESSAKAWRASGWDYEPASISGHDWYTGPGGPRHDRAFIPTPLVLLCTNENYERPKGDIHIKEMANSWSLAYFNHAHHYVRNVKTLESIPSSQILENGWSYGYNAYYGQGSNYTPGGDSRHVDTHAIPNGGNWPVPDKDGLRHFNGWGVDDQHNYCAPAWSVMLLNSPMHVYSAKLRFHANVMSRLGSANRQLLIFGRRQQAWRFLHYVTMWIAGTTSPLGMSRATVESAFQADLESIHDLIYVPAIVENSMSHQPKALRELGLWHESSYTYTSVGQTFYTMPTALWGYICGPLMLMKQSGLWGVMRAKSTKCQLALDFMIECLDKWSCDFIVATSGRSEHAASVLGNQLSAAVAQGSTPTMPSSWAEQATQVPAQGAENWIKNVAGEYFERDVGQHLRAQWAFLHRDYFPEISRANVTEACALYQGFYDEWRAAGRSWTYRMPPHGIIKPQE